MCAKLLVTHRQSYHIQIYIYYVGSALIPHIVDNNTWIGRGSRGWGRGVCQGELSSLAVSLIVHNMKNTCVRVCVSVCVCVLLLLTGGCCPCCLLVLRVALATLPASCASSFCILVSLVTISCWVFCLLIYSASVCVCVCVCVCCV